MELKLVGKSIPDSNKLTQESLRDAEIEFQP